MLNDVTLKLYDTQDGNTGEIKRRARLFIVSDSTFITNCEYTNKKELLSKDVRIKHTYEYLEILDLRSLFAMAVKSMNWYSSAKIAIVFELIPGNIDVSTFPVFESLAGRLDNFIYYGKSFNPIICNKYNVSIYLYL